MEEQQQPREQQLTTTTTTTTTTKYFALSHHKYRILLLLTLAVLGMFFLEAYELLQQGIHTPTADTNRVNADCLKACSLQKNRTGEGVREPCTSSGGCAHTSNLLSNQRTESISEIQARRQAQLRDFCMKYSGTVKEQRDRPRNLLYSDRRGVVYCSVPKVACTNWKRVLQVFEGNLKHPLQIKSKMKIHKLKYFNVNGLAPSERDWRRNLYYSFLFVRHPFERLLSAYRNKFVDTYNPIFQRRYGSKILKLYRPKLPRAVIKAGKNVTFKEFIDFVVYQYDKKGSGVNFDEHWQIVHTLCRPCHMKYNYIGKMETLIEDADQVLKEIGVNGTVKFPANATDKYKSDVRNLMRTYYSQVPRSTLLKLYKIYEDDFLSFGYKIPEYIKSEGS